MLVKARQQQQHDNFNSTIADFRSFGQMTGFVAAVSESEAIETFHETHEFHEDISADNHQKKIPARGSVDAIGSLRDSSCNSCPLGSIRIRRSALICSNQRKSAIVPLQFFVCVKATLTPRREAPPSAPHREPRRRALQGRSRRRGSSHSRRARSGRVSSGSRR